MQAHLSGNPKERRVNVRNPRIDPTRASSTRRCQNVDDDSIGTGHEWLDQCWRRSMGWDQGRRCRNGHVARKGYERLSSKDDDGPITGGERYFTLETTRSDAQLRASLSSLAAQVSVLVGLSSHANTFSMGKVWIFTNVVSPWTPNCR